MKILHFTLGPVQGFIADARRLRDFWAGSFLLSWLSGQAMKAVMDAGGEIIFPEVEGDELFNAIQGKGGTPYIGSLPNRFKARTPEDFDPEQCKRAVEEAWQMLADKIWERFVEPVAGKGNGTQEIWERQVGHFWDIAWVIGDDPGDGSDGRWLDQRKNWRTHREPGDEPADLCTLMGRYQELSGFTRIGEKESQAAFWEALKWQNGFSSLNLREGERLCAIALIKRLFPLVVKDVLGWRPGGANLSVINWPSTSYISAVPWLKMVRDIQSNDLSKAVKEYLELLEKHFEGHKGETEMRLFKGLETGGLYDLDGHLLHEDGVRLWMKENDAVEHAAELIPALNGIQKASGGKPSEFYAILAMDGDRIGAKIGDPEKAELVKNGLAKFTRAVKDHFDPAQGNPHDGVLVYAGGDDVLAFLPVGSAIEAAHTLRGLYDKAFREADVPEADMADYTMSAAIVFTHFKNPMRHALEQAHHYLDDIAKDGNGRDSLAIAVMKPGGVAFDWVSCWKGDAGEPGRVLLKAANSIGGETAEYSTGLLYNIRQRYGPLLGKTALDGGGGHLRAPGDMLDMIESLLVAEYKRQPGKGKTPFADAKAAIQPLIGIGRPLQRVFGQAKPIEGFDFDAPLVARFLSVEGRRHAPHSASREGEGKS